MAKEDKKIDFESSLKKLESIVQKLEDENINQESELKIKKLLDDGSIIELEKS